VRVFILDEVDRMLDMGFLPDIRKVLDKVPAERRTGFFSATLPPKILSLAETMVKDPVRVTISPETPTVEKITQRLLYVEKKSKDRLLASMIKEQRMDRVIVFTQMKHVANRVCEKLKKAGISAAPIHGNRSQAQRTQALDGFRRGKVHVLVATDIAARGIDVDRVTDVFNYDLPLEPENYVHRIGRTARAGTEGRAWTFCTGEDRQLLRNVERLIKKPIEILKDHDCHSEIAYNTCQESGRPSKGGGADRRGSRGRNKFQGSKNYSRFSKKKRR
jgi:ATP-dependent RNA helicase RhlE